MTWLFLSAAGFCLYTYVIFPFILHLRAQRKSPHQPENPSQWPSCSIVIAAHNEAARLPEKLATLQALDYPEDRLQCVFVSDGSTDNTEQLLQVACADNDQWIVHSYTPAAGKPTALNVGVQQASGEIIVFMDARQRISANAIKVLVSHLTDENIGSVSGELVLADKCGNEAANVGLYWRYEKWIRGNESRLYSTTGATGALYAIRRKDYTPHAVDVLLDDFDTPVRLLLSGKRTLLAAEAKVFDYAEAHASQEFQRKVRTLAGNFQSFSRHPGLFDPRQNKVWWQFISHKVFRLLVPYALGLALLSCLLGNTVFLQVMLVLQLVFYTIGVIGFLTDSGSQSKLTSFVKVFLQLNAAAVAGAARFFSGNTRVTWKRT